MKIKSDLKQIEIICAMVLKYFTLLLTRWGSDIYLLKMCFLLSKMLNRINESKSYDTEF